MYFFFHDPQPSEIYTLSLHDALPIFLVEEDEIGECPADVGRDPEAHAAGRRRPRPPRCAADRKSTRLNSSHGYISYAVFCLKKKNQPSRRRRGYICLPRTITEALASW